MDNFNYKSHCKDMTACMGIIISFIKTATSFKNHKIYIIKSSINGCSTSPETLSYNEISITINFSECCKNNIGARAFAENFYTRAEIPEFSNLTLMLLHELGHNETNSLTSDFDRENALTRLYNYSGKNKKIINERYFSFPDEYFATSWAIQWLSNKKNQKIARKFEEEFFAAWKGEN